MRGYVEESEESIARRTLFAKARLFVAYDLLYGEEEGAVDALLSAALAYAVAYAATQPKPKRSRR